MATTVITMELLGRGEHASPRRGCSALEYASVLAGERWDSRPQSVHPALADVAGIVNDQMSDDRRRLLTPLMPWLLGTSTVGPRTWPAITGVCVRAALARAGEPDESRLLADLDATRNWLAEAGLPADERRPAPWAGWRKRRWARHVIRSALLAVTASADREEVDARLCEVLVDCVNECRRLTGEPAVDPRLPLAECPRRLAVESHVMWSRGCDWMELGYRLVRPLSPEWPDAARVQPAREKRGSAAVPLFWLTHGMRSSDTPLPCVSPESGGGPARPRPRRLHWR